MIAVRMMVECIKCFCLVIVQEEYVVFEPQLHSSGCADETVLILPVYC